MAEPDPIWIAINAHPGNWFFIAMILGQLLDRWSIGSNRLMAGHALGCDGKCHLLTRFGIGVTFLAFQSHGNVRLVTVGNRLQRWSSCFW